MPPRRALAQCGVIAARLMEATMRAPHAALGATFLALAATFGSGCEDSIGPTTGAIQVTVSMTGLDADSARFSVSVDDGLKRPTGTGGSITIPGLTPGPHSLRLDYLAPDCTVSGDNPRTVTVAAGQTTIVAFSLVCTAAPTGSARVSITTRGVDLDDGYFLLLERGNVSVSFVWLRNDTTVTLGPLAVGTYTVALGDVARNCAVGGSNSRSVTIVPDHTADVAFEATCTALGSLRVTAVTTGMDPDPSGYTLTVSRVDFYRTTGLATNGTVTLTGMAAGEYTVTLAGVSTNCVIRAPLTLSLGPVTVVSGETVAVVFSIECTALPRLAYSADGDIYVINADGTDATRVTTHPERDDYPTWSPDGSRIAFASWRDASVPELYVSNADGTNLVRLTNSPAEDTQPAWSPDGSTIAFMSWRDGNAELYVMNADGTNPLRLTNGPAEDSEPAWSPDGSKIVFTSDRDGNREIYVMNADGTNAVRLTNNFAHDSDPAWSPDGSRIAFTSLRDRNAQVYVMNADGTNPVRLTNSVTEDTDPAWSPDGSRIAYVEDYFYYYYYYSYHLIRIVTMDGRPDLVLVNGPADNPAWRR